MTIAADTGYGHRLEDAFKGKAHHISLGCSKARLRYQYQRFAPSCSGLPRRATPLFERRRAGLPRSSRLLEPIVAWHDPAHKLVEQRHGECRIAVTGAPNHALGDKLISGGTERRNFALQYPGDIA